MSDRNRDPAADARWREARGIVLARDGRRCAACGASAGLHIHHLVPRALGGPDEPANLIVLCDGCHAARHATLQGSLGERALRRWAFRLARLLDRRGDLPADATHLQAALRALGRERFRDGQLPAVLAALRGESLLVVRPTGSGKSLCFQAPALLTPGATYVISPLKALMADQISDLTSRHVPATFINSDLSAEEKRIRFALLADGAVKLLYLAPERFDPASVRDPAEIARLAAGRPSYLVIDEAHCVDRWGDGFRPSDGRLAEVRRALGDPPVLAFTATAGTRMQDRIVRSLGVPDARRLVSDIDRPNIAIVRAAISRPDERLAAAERLMARARAEGGKSLIFVASRRMGEELSGVFAARGRDLPFYHGQLPASEREFLLGRITGRISPPLDSLLCTNAFGMGIDIPDIRVVLHWAEPGSVEDWVQEFGRAGRDGRPSLAVTWDWPGGRSLRRFMIERAAAERAAAAGTDPAESLRRKLEELADLETLLHRRDRCARAMLLAHFREERPRRPSLAIRIAERLFSERQPVARGAFCCDACQPDHAARALGYRDRRALAAAERR
ncbi:MAG: RecQ family ATP-dependent DNA helicase [Chloroflexota bacterium]